jgi:hypothetical protein
MNAMAELNAATDAMLAVGVGNAVAAPAREVQVIAGPVNGPDRRSRMRVIGSVGKKGKERKISANQLRMEAFGGETVVEGSARVRGVSKEEKQKPGREKSQFEKLVAIGAGPGMRVEPLLAGFAGLPVTLYQGAPVEKRAVKRMRRFWAPQPPMSDIDIMRKMTAEDRRAERFEWGVEGGSGSSSSNA